jgi:hypothetical protein
MEEIISKVFNHPEATQLKFIYYKQRHVQPVVFFKAVQMQQKHEQSHRVIAVEGLHPDHHFLFEVMLRKTFPQIIAALPTSRTHQTNVYGYPKGRNNLLTSTSDFASIARQVAENFPAMYYQHLKNQGIDVQEDVFQAPKVISRIHRLDDSFGSSLSFGSRSTFFTSSASYYDNIQLDLTDFDQYPTVVEAGPTTTAPSVPSGISGTVSPLPPTRGSYSSALSKTPSTIPTPKDPEMQALQDQVTKLTAIIEDLKAQTVPPTPPPAPDPTAPSAQDLAKQVEQGKSAVTSLQDQFR